MDDPSRQHTAACQGRTLDLVELCQVGAVDGLVPEHAVDGEVFGGLEAVLLRLRQAVQHAAGHRRGVRPQQVLLRF